MQKNVGGYDRLARFVLGPLLIVVGGVILAGLWSPIAGTTAVAVSAVAILVGLVFVVTATTQKCPLNKLLGLNTYRPPSDEDTGQETDTQGAKPS